jgi:hypothetical protein
MAFELLQEELNKWSDSGHIAKFWWRDDDVQKPSAQLDKLLAINDKHHVSLSLATIPDGVQLALAECLEGRDQVCVLQHGFSHQNFAPASERKMELGWHRPAAQINAQIATGFADLQTLFGKHFVPAMVPPWNRIDPRVIAGLHAAGLHGLSTLGPREQIFPVEGVKQINVHVDIINWKQGRSFAGDEACVAQMISHLCAKREGRADIEEPTGIMSHHLVHDAGCWGFLNAVFGFLNEQENTEVLDARTIFTA